MRNVWPLSKCIGVSLWLSLSLSWPLPKCAWVGGWMDTTLTNNVCVCANPAYPLTVADWLAGSESRSGGAGAGSIIAFWTCCVCPPELLAYILIL